MASEMDWWAVPLVAFVAFTLYGIEGIAQTYEDPFGLDKIDINMDDIVEDTRREVEVMLHAWQTQGSRGGLFRPTASDGMSSETSSEYYNGETSNVDQLRVVVSDLNQEIQKDAAERERQRLTKISFGTSPRPIRRGASEYYSSEEAPLLATNDLRNESTAVSPGTVLGKDYLTIERGTSQLRPDAGTSGAPRISWSDGVPLKSPV